MRVYRKHKEDIVRRASEARGCSLLIAELTHTLKGWKQTINNQQCRVIAIFVLQRGPRVHYCVGMLSFSPITQHLNPEDIIENIQLKLGYFWLGFVTPAADEHQSYPVDFVQKLVWPARSQVRTNADKIRYQQISHLAMTDKRNISNTSWKLGQINGYVKKKKVA